MLIILALLPFAYVGSYFAVLALPSTVHIPPFLTNRPNGIQVGWLEFSGKWDRYPNYHGLPEWLFAPVHHFDRTHLRPTWWSGTYPGNSELGWEFVEK